MVKLPAGSPEGSDRASATFVIHANSMIFSLARLKGPNLLNEFVTMKLLFAVFFLFFVFFVCLLICLLVFVFVLFFYLFLSCRKLN